MFSKVELLDAIRECEREPSNYPDCAKLATFYTLYDHLYSGKAPEIESTVGTYGDSDFYSAIAGGDASRMWSCINDLMDTIKITQPRLYTSVMARIAQERL